MARETLFTHRKFVRLVAALDGDDVAAVGHLEWLWRAASGSGDPVLGDAADVEMLAHWSGDPGVLLHALLEAGGAVGPGFIEQLEGRPDVYEIHDYEDHAPEYTGRRGAAEARRRSSGHELRELRRELGRKGGLARAAAAAADPEKAEANRRNLEGSVHGVNDLSEANPKLPKPPEATCKSPAPAPAPLREEKDRQAASRNGSRHPGQQDVLKAEFSEDFQLWAETLPARSRAAVKPTDGRWKVYQARRKDSTRDEIRQALQGWKCDPWEGRAEHNGFSILLRTREQVEKFSSSPHSPFGSTSCRMATRTLWLTSAGAKLKRRGWIPRSGSPASDEAW